MHGITDPRFADDDGSTPGVVREALARYAEDPDARHAETLAVLQGQRVLVPVVARATEVEYDEQGLAHDKTAETAAVLLRGRDGRLALLAFTGTEAMRTWDPQARPVPVSLAQAGEAAQADGAAALLLDLTGPVRMVIEGDDLASLARGDTLVELGGRWAWVRPTP